MTKHNEPLNFIVTISVIFTIILFDAYPYYYFMNRTNNNFVKNIINTLNHWHHAHIFPIILCLLIGSAFEKEHGSIKYISMIVYFIIMNSVIKEVFNKVYSLTRLSMRLDNYRGFYGVIFGLMTTYDYPSTNKYNYDYNYQVLIWLFCMFPLCKRETFTGCFLGVISGFLFLFVNNFFYAK